MDRTRRVGRVNVDASSLIMALLIITFSSTIQGSVGFGANLIAAPMLALIDTAFVPGPIFIASTSRMIAAALRERDQADWHFVGWAGLGRVPGVAAGALVLGTVSDSSLRLLVALTIILAVVLSSGIVKVPESRTTFAVAGALSGFGATSASIGGPPVALALQHRSGPQVRSSMSAFFVIGATMTLPAMALAGRLGSAEILTGLALVPASQLGFIISGPLRKYVDAGRVRPIVLSLSVISATALILKIIL